MKKTKKQHKKSRRARELEALYDLTLTRNEGASTLKATTSPYSWRYRSYGLEIKVEMDEGRGGEIFLKDRSTKFAMAKVASVERLFALVKLVPCSCCGKPALDRSPHQTTPDHLCEVCFMKEQHEKFDKERAKELRRNAVLEKKRKSSGYTHLVSAWIHSNEGDDSMIEFWMRRAPNKAEMATILKQKGSCILDDYSVKVL